MNEILSMEGPTSDLLAYLLLLLITTTVSGIICVVSILYYLRNRRAASLGSSAYSGKGRYESSIPPVPGFIFDRPSCWLAIRSRNIGCVQEALGLENATAVVGWRV